jgi:hypothetical protein
MILRPSVGAKREPGEPAECDEEKDETLSCPVPVKSAVDNDISREEVSRSEECGKSEPTD